MNTSTSRPTITRKYPIEVPTNTYGSPVAVYKIYFGKAYFIWKGLSLLQSSKQIAESIERYIRLDKNEPTNIIDKVAKYIVKHRIKTGKIEVVETDFLKKSTTTGINCLAILKLEQQLLDESSEDALCLNVNKQAYVSSWIQNDHAMDVIKFNAFLEKRKKK